MARRLHALSPTPPPRPILCRGYNPKGNGPHDSDISTAPRVDLERLDGLSTRVAGEGPRGVRPSTVPVEGALERRELLRPHRPEHLGAPLDPPGDGTGHRGAETGTFFGPGRFRAPCRFVTRLPPTARPSVGTPAPRSTASTRSSRSAECATPGPS